MSRVQAILRRLSRDTDEIWGCQRLDLFTGHLVGDPHIFGGPSAEAAGQKEGLFRGELIGVTFARRLDDEGSRGQRMETGRALEARRAPVLLQLGVYGRDVLQAVLAVLGVHLPTDGQRERG